MHRKTPRGLRDRGRRQASLGFQRFEMLESRCLLTSMSGSFGISPSGAIDTPALAGDTFVHDLTFDLTNATGSTSALLNASDLNSSQTAVSAIFSGTIVGPMGSTLVPNNDELDIMVNGKLAETITGSQFSGPGFGNNSDTLSFGPSGSQPSTINSLSFPPGQSNNAISVVFKDLSTNQSFTPISNFPVVVDTVNPQITTLGPVSSPTTSPVGSVPIAFNESIVPSSFDFNVLTLTRNGVTVPLDSSVTVTPDAGSTTNFTIGGLSAFTANTGSYVLTVDGRKILDPSGNPGIGIETVAFVENISGPTFIGLGPVASPTTTPVGAVNAVFSAPVDPASLNVNALTLTYNGVVVPLNSVTIAPAFASSTVTIGGLSSLMANSGTYVLTLNASQIQDPSGNFSSGTQSVTFVENIPGPTFTSLGPVASPTTTPVDSVSAVFSGPIDPTSFTSATLTLTRNGVNVPLNNSVTVTAVAGSSSIFTISGLAGLTANSGSYVLTVDASQIHDLSGNYSSGSRSVAFFESIPGPSLTALDPVSSPTTTPVDTVSAVFSGPIDPASFTYAALTLTDDGVYVPLNSSVTITPVAGSSASFTIGGLSAFTQTSGTYVLTLNAGKLYDPSGNFSSGSESVSFVESIVPPGSPVPPVLPTADLVVSAQAPTGLPRVGVPLTFVYSVTNNSLITATGVSMEVDLSRFQTATINSVTPSQGSTATVPGNPNLEVADFGTLAPGASATITVVLTPTQTGLLVGLAAASGNQPDPNPVNNLAYSGAIVTLPQVTGVQVQQSGKNVTGLVLTFDSPLPLSGAGNLHNYQLTVPGKKGRGAVKVQVKSATYDPTRNVVTLRLTGSLPRLGTPIQLIVGGPGSPGFIAGDMSILFEGSVNIASKKA